MAVSELTLKAAIRQQFRNRILFTFGMLFFIAGLFSSVEVWFSMLQLKERLDLHANQLQQEIISEILVDNDQAVTAILKNENDKNKTYSVIWEPKDASILASQFQTRFPSHWSYAVPVKTFGDARYGTLTYKGDFLKQPEIATILVGKLLLVLVACAAIGLLVYPLAQRIPNELILNPIRDLLHILRSDEPGDGGKAHIVYQELKDIFNDFHATMTRKRQLEDERVEMQKMITVTHTAQMLAHDMRKPFNLVRMVMHTLQGARTWESTKSFIGGSLPGVNRALNQLDDMLKELVEVGKDANLNQEAVDAAEVVKTSAQELQISHNAGTTAITVELGHTDALWVDKAQFGRAFSNIFLNALQATGRNGRIWVRSKMASGVGKPMVEFCIGNAGSFIPEEDRQKIFNIFYTNGKKSGTGLGLAIAQKVVRSHGGNIWCESSAEQGTEFHFTLPSVSENRVLQGAAIKEPTESLSPAISPKTHTNRIIKALIVDDETVFSDHAAQILSDCGKAVDIVKCADGAAAIDAAKLFRPDIVLCDIELGQSSLDGHEIVRVLRQAGLTSFIHVHTNRMFHDDESKAKAAGANQFSQKPFTDALAKNILRQVTAGE